MNSKEQKEWDEFNIKIMAFLMFGFGFFWGIVFSLVMLK